MDSKDLFSRYLLILCASLLAGSFFVPGYYKILYPKPLGAQAEFTPNVQRGGIKEISQDRPEIVLVGDSILYTGVENRELSKALDVKTNSIAVPGSGSAIWYLILKNVILQAKHHPKYVVIPFRDTQLTLPSFRTTGHYFSVVDEYASAHEPLLMDLAYINTMNPAEKIAEQYFPPYSARWLLRDGLNRHLRYFAPSTLLNCPERCTDNAINAVLNKEAMNNINFSIRGAYDVNILYARAALDFENQVDQSFLPVIIQLARENNITLVFVRMKNLDYPTHAYETPALSNYIRSLEAYLSKQANVRYLDLSHDERILPAYFSDGAHFNEGGKSAFTLILAGELNKIIK
jgi:hypothetical protein